LFFRTKKAYGIYIHVEAIDNQNYIFSFQHTSTSSCALRCSLMRYKRRSSSKTAATHPSKSERDYNG